MGWQRSLIHSSLVSLKPPRYEVVFFCDIFVATRDHMFDMSSDTFSVIRVRYTHYLKLVCFSASIL